MTRRREIQLHLKSLKDINGIMGSMKNLSLVEIRKLERFLSAQKRVVESTKSMACCRHGRLRRVLRAVGWAPGPVVPGARGRGERPGGADRGRRRDR